MSGFKTTKNIHLQYTPKKNVGSNKMYLGKSILEGMKRLIIDVELQTRNGIDPRKYNDTNTQADCRDAPVENYNVVQLWHSKMRKCGHESGRGAM